MNDLGSILTLGWRQIVIGYCIVLMKIETNIKKKVPSCLIGWWRIYCLVATAISTVQQYNIALISIEKNSLTEVLIHFFACTLSN